MERGQLIAVNNQIVEYDRYDKYLDIHCASEIMIDEVDGHLTSTYAPCCFTTEELTEGFNKINLTETQWYGIVECIIRQNHDYLTEEAITEATEDIVGRCFVMNMPQFDELEDYITCYMDR